MLKQVPYPLLYIPDPRIHQKFSRNIRKLFWTCVWSSPKLAQTEGLKGEQKAFLVKVHPNEHGVALGFREVELFLVTQLK